MPSRTRLLSLVPCLLSLVSCLLLLASTPAFADDADSDEEPVGLSIMFMHGAGGGFTGSGSAFVGARLAWLTRMPLALELSWFVGYPMLGVSNVSTLLYFFHNDYWRMHVNLGWAALARPITSPEVPRAWDLTLGTGIEFTLPPKLLVRPLKHLPLTITLDYRAFFADPTTVPLLFGDFARAIYREALLGGQIWLGLGLRFSL